MLESKQKISSYSDRQLQLHPRPDVFPYRIGILPLDTDQSLVAPLEDNEADKALFIPEIGRFLNLGQDEGVNRAPPASLAIHAIAFLRLLVGLYTVRKSYPSRQRAY